MFTVCSFDFGVSGLGLWGLEVLEAFTASERL